MADLLDSTFWDLRRGASAGGLGARVRLDCEFARVQGG